MSLDPIPRLPRTKAFENGDFLASHDARFLRILCEFQEPQARLRRHHVKGTVLFFGSARSMYREDWDKAVAQQKSELVEAKTEAARSLISAKLERLKKVEWMCPWADAVEALAKRITEWAMEDTVVKNRLIGQPDYLAAPAGHEEATTQPLVVLSGGGPGIMAAANRGAASVPGAKTIGMGISLPFESGNSYVTPDLAFEFHYFFTRKFWMMYSAKALVVGPGGFGTFDELFELLTLRQTGKFPDIPVVLLGCHYWKNAINWQFLADSGTISQDDVDRLCFTDDVETAFQFIVSHLEKADEAQLQASLASPTSNKAE